MMPLIIPWKANQNAMEGAQRNRRCLSVAGRSLLHIVQDNALSGKAWSPRKGEDSGGAQITQ